MVGCSFRCKGQVISPGACCIALSVCSCVWPCNAWKGESVSLWQTVVPFIAPQTQHTPSPHSLTWAALTEMRQGNRASIVQPLTFHTLVCVRLCVCAWSFIAMSKVCVYMHGLSCRQHVVCTSLCVWLCVLSCVSDGEGNKRLHVTVSLACIRLVVWTLSDRGGRGEEEECEKERGRGIDRWKWGRGKDRQRRRETDRYHMWPFWLQ